MSESDALRGRAIVMQPDEGPSYWQPVPASGHSDPKLYPSTSGLKTLALGYQTVAPHGRIREHSHGDQVEIQVCFRGRGRALVNGESHPLVPGTVCMVGYDIKHEIVNDSDEELVMMWIITPPGLENFFASIGRPRTPGEPAPAPFARPDDVVAIERAMGMNDTR